jgi:TonB family protein
MMREEHSPKGRGSPASRRRAAIAAVLPPLLLATIVGGLTSPAAPGQAAGGAGDSPPGGVLDLARPAADFVEIDGLLRQGIWTGALARLRTRETRLIARPVGRGEWLARVALAEAGSGQNDQALWHWAVANALTQGLFTDQELSAFGGAGALLADHPRRQAGKAPSGMSVEPPGPEVERQVKKQGEVPQLARGAWSPRQWLRLEVVVDEQGRLRDPVVLSARSGEAAYRALEAIRDWRFEPAKKRGQPVATLHSMVFNPPGRLALEKVINPSAQTKAIEGMLRRHQWRQAAGQAEAHWYGLLDSTALGARQEAERAALGMTMGLWALARAGLEPQEPSWARCHWEAAQSLMPTLYDLDLSPYGPAGEAVAAWQSEAFTAPFQPISVRPSTEKRRGEVTKPEKIAAQPPYYPLAAKKQRLSGRVVLESIIDAEGRVRNPAVLVPTEAGDLVPFAASALDTVCGWRFKPATLEGRPVKVYYTLTVSFEVRSH